MAEELGQLDPAVDGRLGSVWARLAISAATQSRKPDSPTVGVRLCRTTGKGR